MYLSASIPMVGPMVLVMLTPQYFHRGAWPAELLPPNHSLITAFVQQNSLTITSNFDTQISGINPQDVAWNAVHNQATRKGGKDGEGAHLWRTRRSRRRSARSWGTQGARTAAPPARIASSTWGTAEQNPPNWSQLSLCAVVWDNIREGMLTESPGGRPGRCRRTRSRRCRRRGRPRAPPCSPRRRRGRGVGGGWRRWRRRRRGLGERWTWCRFAGQRRQGIGRIAASGGLRCAVVAGKKQEPAGVIGVEGATVGEEGGARQRSDVAWSDWGKRARTDARLAGWRGTVSAGPSMSCRRWARQVCWASP